MRPANRFRWFWYPLMHESRAKRYPWVGWFLIVTGVVGTVTGFVPLTINALRIVVSERRWDFLDLAAHGVEAMGLSIEWGMLSSAMGVCLGGFMLCAGVGWLKGRPWAAPVSWTYVLAGLTVNISDMIIFAFRARPGEMRTGMLLCDGVALLIPVLLGVWLIAVHPHRRPGGSDAMTTRTPEIKFPISRPAGTLSPCWGRPAGSRNSKAIWETPRCPAGCRPFASGAG